MFLELKGLENMPGIASNGKVKPQVAAAFTRMHLTPSKFLRRSELGSRNVSFIVQHIISYHNIAIIFSKL